jgi:tRNA pseudouridine55 synthase
LTVEDILSGQVLLVDKPLHWTSYQAVAKIKYALQKVTGKKKLKVGHAGTLDPLATGLLIICVGKKTKEISDFMGLPKEYLAQVKLGATTPSYDLESDVDQQFPTDHINLDVIQEVIEIFKGAISQVPPIFSAIKKDGIRAYEKARAGEEVVMAPRQVIIHELEILKYSDQVLELRVRCSKGTYIRSLAHDLGKALNSGGHLVGLRRTKIGSYEASNGKGPNEWAQYFFDEFRSA